MLAAHDTGTEGQRTLALLTSSPLRGFNQLGVENAATRRIPGHICYSVLWCVVPAGSNLHLAFLKALALPVSKIAEKAQLSSLLLAVPLSSLKPGDHGQHVGGLAACPPQVSESTL